VEKFVPWKRDVVILTNGQVPTWWNSSHPHGRIVTHEEVFLEKARKEDGTRDETMVKMEGALPTFSSNAIEANLHNVPGLSKYILYLNDDFLIGRPLTMDKFLDLETGQLKLNMGGFEAPDKAAMRRNIWHASVGHSNELINSKYHPGSPQYPHRYSGHVCYFLHKDVIDNIYNMWPEEFEQTSRRKFRSREDTSLPFMMVNVAIEEKLGVPRSPIVGGYSTWSTNHKKNSNSWTAMMRRGADCLCVQDGFEDLNSDAVDKEVAFLEEKLCEFLPDKCSFERSDEPNPCDKYK